MRTKRIRYVTSATLIGATVIGAALFAPAAGYAQTANSAGQGGVYRIGTQAGQVAPGLYHSNGNPSCNWEIDGFGKSAPVVRAKGGWDGGPQTIMLEPTDHSVGSWNCGKWTRVESATSTPSPLPSLAAPTTPANFPPQITGPAATAPHTSSGATTRGSVHIPVGAGISFSGSGVHSGSGS